MLKTLTHVSYEKFQSKLDQGENCLSAALPCDVAGLLKQFFRELPEPILPPQLQEGLFKAQQLGNEKKTATVLLSCLMADRTIAALRYFFSFLRTVSLRSVKGRACNSLNHFSVQANAVPFCEWFANLNFHICRYSLNSVAVLYFINPRFSLGNLN